MLFCLIQLVIVLLSGSHNSLRDQSGTVFTFPLVHHIQQIWYFEPVIAR